MGAPELTFVNNSTPQCGAESLNAFTQELNNIITNMGLTISDTTWDQVFNAVVKGIMTGTFFEYSGTANAVILTSLGSKTAAATYYDGYQASFISTTVNTGATTINIDGIGVKDLKTIDGDDLSGGEVTGFMTVVYRSDEDYFMITTSSEHEPTLRTDEIAKMLLGNSEIVIYPTVTGEYASVSGDYTAPSAATHLVVLKDGANQLVEIINGPATGTITALDVDSNPMTATIGGTSYNLRLTNITQAVYSNSDFTVDPWYWINNDGMALIGGITDSLAIGSYQNITMPFTLTYQGGVYTSPQVAAGTGNEASSGGIFNSNVQVAISNTSDTSSFAVWWVVIGWVDITA